MSHGEATAAGRRGDSNWNGADDLRSCLESLRSQEGVELEIMVTDNGSSDGSVEFLESQGLAHLPLPRSLGFARAINLHVAAADAGLALARSADGVLGCRTSI